MSTAPQPVPPTTPHPAPAAADAAEQPLLTVEQAAQRLGVGRSLMYELIMSGQIESVTIGRLRRIPAEALGDYIARLRAGTTTATAA